MCVSCELEIIVFATQITSSLTTIQMLQLAHVQWAANGLLSPGRQVAIAGLPLGFALLHKFQLNRQHFNYATFTS